jgi:uncharacterized SAM-binding protein YcdF (DUF218 family)
MLNSKSNAKVLYQYLFLYEKPQKSDLVIGFGIDDMRVPDTCSRLYHSSNAPAILFTGGVGKGSGSLTVPEAIAFRDRAVQSGVPSASILVEQNSANTLENVLFSIKLLEDKQLYPKSIIIVTKPHLQRRVWLTCKKHFKDTVFINHPYPSNFEEEIKWYKNYRAFVQSIEGEIRRIIEYGKAGDLEEEPLPTTVETAYQALRSIT